MITKRGLLYLLFILCMTLVVIAHEIWTFSGTYQNRSADVAIVLGASIVQNKPSAVFAQRIHHAINLYKQQKVKYLIFTGGTSADNLLSESEVAKTYAIQKGVLGNSIFIEKTSTITYENLIEAQKIMRKNNLNTALVVSDPLHMKRAMTMAHDLNLNAAPAPTSSSMYRTLKTQLPFLAREVFFYSAYKIASLFGLERPPLNSSSDSL